MLFKIPEKTTFNVLLLSKDNRNITIISEELKQLNWKINLITVNNVQKAKNISQKNKLDLLIIFGDVFSKQILFDFIGEFKDENSNREVPVITFFNNIQTSERIKLIDLGVETILIKPIPQKEFKAVIRNRLKYRFINKELEHVQKVLYSFTAAMEANDPYTSGHSYRVAQLSIILGKKINLSDTKLNCLYAGALIHDIGKVGISETIINKPGKLNEKEYNIIKKHPEIGLNILRYLSSIDPVKKIVHYHHEKWNGMGYPEGLFKKEIPYESRIVAIVDSIDAMLSNRPYRKGMDPKKVRKILEEGKGSQWDPSLVDFSLDENIIDLCIELNLEWEENKNSSTNLQRYQFKDI